MQLSDADFQGRYAMRLVGSAGPGVTVIAPTTRLALRIAACLALAILYATAFHYAKKYEGEMLTDAAPADAAAILGKS
jgi:hypothetical protein